MQNIQNEEKSAFSDFNDESKLAEACLKKNLFIINNLEVIPACSKKLFINYPIDPSAIDKYYSSGIKAMNENKTKEALDFFDVAVKGQIYSPDNLQKKLEIYNYILDLRREDRLQNILNMLYYLNHYKKYRLIESRREIFYNKLEKNIDYPLIEKRYAELWELVGEIEKVFKGHTKRPIRLIYKSSMISIDNKNRVYLSSDQWYKSLFVKPPVQISQKLPDMSKILFYKKINIQPPLYLWILQKEVQSENIRIQKQYQLSKRVLWLMVGLCVVLIIGIIISMYKERKLSRMKAEFITSASHELRTPLALIRLFSETLFYGRVKEEKKQEYYQNILFESERLSGLVNNVLDFSRMSSGRRKINPENIDLSDLCNKTVDPFSYRVKKEGFKMKKNIKPNIFARVDKLALTQVIFNLIDNAIKYSEKKKEIEIILEKQKQNVILKVKDKGIGIPNKIKKKVFNEFFRADDQRVSSQRGSGIGLNVTKNLIETMNGKIEIQDNKPYGTIFTVYLPAIQEKKHENTCCGR